MVYGKHHVLCQEQAPIDKIILIKSGWVRRVRGVPFDAASTGVAVGMGQSSASIFWAPETVWDLKAWNRPRVEIQRLLMARTEVLEVPVAPLGDDLRCAPASSRPSPRSQLPTTTRPQSS